MVNGVLKDTVVLIFTWDIVKFLLRAVTRDISWCPDGKEWAATMPFLSAGW